MRMNNMWDTFMSLVEFEYQILKFKQEGYKIRLISNDSSIDANGRVNKYKSSPYHFSIETELDGVVERIDLEA